MAAFFNNSMDGNGRSARSELQSTMNLLAEPFSGGEPPQSRWEQRSTSASKSSPTIHHSCQAAVAQLIVRRHSREPPSIMRTKCFLIGAGALQLSSQLVFA